MMGEKAEIALKPEFVAGDGAKWMDGGWGVAKIASSSQVPTEFALRSVYPNPFNSNTTLMYTLPSDGRVTLTIRNLAGQVVKTVVSEMETKGDYLLSLEVGDLQSGVYFATLSLKSDGKEILKTIRLVKGN